MAIDTNEADGKMKQTLERLHNELKKIRTGRASASMLDGVSVAAYGQEMPLKHAANIVALDGQMLQVSPFDPNNLEAISTAISESNLGLNPSDDGHVVRVPIPPLTEERREELAKSLSEKAEEARVALRNVRHDALKGAKQQQQEGEISEDDYHRTEKALNELIDKHNSEIEQALETKQSEIMKV
ncbi:MAG TPA: ribosome recycling factor [Candidatus Saccharimonadales bacterium]|jgi:ribosome recycling factor